MRIVANLLFLLLAVVCVLPAQGQSTLSEKQKAVVVFDVRMDMIMSSELAKEMGFAQQMSQMAQMSGQEGADPASVERVFGAMSAPESMEDAAAMQSGGPLPFEFFVRMKYKDAESAKTDFDARVGEDDEKIEKGGRTFFKSSGAGGVPPGLLIQMVDDKTMELATETYAFHADRKVFTDNLKASWAKAPNEAIRLAMDLEGAKGLVAELIKEGIANAPQPGMEDYLGLIDNIKDLRLSLDFSGKNLLSLNANAIDTENAEELKSGLDSLLFIAQTGGKQGVKMIEERDPATAKVAVAILDSLVAKNSGNDVSIEIPQPSGFVKAVQAAGGIVGGMMMGGGPPGGGPPGGGRPPGGRPPGDGF